MYTERFTECHALLAYNAPVTGSTATNSGWLNIQNYARVIVLISVGAMAGSATFNARIEEAKDAGVTGVANITGKAITALAAATDADTALAIELRADELTSDFNHIRVVYTPAVANVTYSAMVFGLVPRYAAVDVSEWEQIVP